MSDLYAAPVLEALDRLEVPVSASEAGGRIVYVNPAFCAEFEILPEQVIGLAATEQVPPEERSILLDHWSAWEDGRADLIRLRLPGPRGGTRPYWMVPAPLLDEDGKLLGVVGLFLRAEPGTLASAGRTPRAALREIVRGVESVRGAPEDARDSLARLPGADALTSREREVLQLLARGDRVANIAQRLGIQPVTVRNHLKAVFRKTGIRNQRALIQHLRGH